MFFVVESKRHGRFNVILDDGMEDVARSAKWVVDMKKDGSPYIRGRVGLEKKLVYLHRFIINAPPNLIVDHINRNTLDNSLCNLRIVSPKSGINQRNTKVSHLNKTNYKGVFKNKKGKFEASCSIDGVNNFLGVYNTPQEAAFAYDEFVLKNANGVGINGVEKPKEYKFSARKYISPFLQGVSKPIKAGKNKPFMSKVMINKKNIFLGYFSTELDAAIARDEFLLKNGVLDHKRYSLPHLTLNKKI